MFTGRFSISVLASVRINLALYFVPKVSVKSGIDTQLLQTYLIVSCRVAFSSAIVVSATSLILEREEGMLDRTYVAGQLNRIFYHTSV